MKQFYLILFLISFSMFSFAQTNVFDVARKGTLEDISTIYKNNPEAINSTDENGYLPLTLACYYGNNDVASFLVNKVKDINGTSKFGTPLMAAVVKGNVIIAKLLLDNKANPNIADSNGTTALHYAVMFKNYEIIEFLINANADINIKDNRQQSALDYANMYKDTKLTNLLMN